MDPNGTGYVDWIQWVTHLLDVSFLLLSLHPPPPPPPPPHLQTCICTLQFVDFSPLFYFSHLSHFPLFPIFSSLCLLPFPSLPFSSSLFPSLPLPHPPSSPSVSLARATSQITSLAFLFSLPVYFTDSGF